MITLEEERAEEEEEEKILDRKAGYHSWACVTSSKAKEREKKEDLIQWKWGWRNKNPKYQLFPQELAYV